jgi:hypothetical protein
VVVEVVEVAARLLAGSGCADEKFVKGALRVGPSRHNEISLRVATGVMTELLVDTIPLSRDVLKRL